MPVQLTQSPPIYRIHRYSKRLWAVLNDNGRELASFPTLDLAFERTKAMLQVHPSNELDRIWGVSPNEFLILCRLRHSPARNLEQLALQRFGQQ